MHTELKKIFFYSSIFLICLFELMRVYLIMPMPLSQLYNTVEWAYVLHQVRWMVRIALLMLIAINIRYAFETKYKGIPVVILILGILFIYLFNFKLAAVAMFLPCNQLQLKNKNENTLSPDRLVIGVSNNGEAKAYPIEFLAYHHQIIDTIGNQIFMITYCSVCRTARVFEPYINGHYTTFRLVGMDHFNAMFEDHITGSWWRQATGEAICGPSKGQLLKEHSASQLSIAKWFELYPDAKVMQAGDVFLNKYDADANFEKGKSTSSLTRRDAQFLMPKSWVIGVKYKEQSKAYDWNLLVQQSLIQDTIAASPIFMVLSKDAQSFAAFENLSRATIHLNNDTIFVGNDKYSLLGASFTNHTSLSKIQCYQEYWHSWKYFHPNTLVYSI